MDKIKVYHNPRCSKSRMAISYLEDRNIDIEIIEYLKELPTKDELKSVIEKLGISAEELIRKGEQDFKDNYKGRQLSEDQWIEVMIKNPKLIERPIVIKSGKAVIARPTEKIEDLL